MRAFSASCDRGRCPLTVSAFFSLQRYAAGWRCEAGEVCFARPTKETHQHTHTRALFDARGSAPTTASAKAEIIHRETHVLRLSADRKFTKRSEPD